MKEELTTKMHSEFQCSKADDIRNRVFSVLKIADYSNKENLKKYALMYQVTLGDVEKHKKEFDKLKNV
jgi:acyl-CoA-binding protein